MYGYVFQFREVFAEMPLLLSGAVVTLHISLLTLFFMRGARALEAAPRA